MWLLVRHLFVADDYLKNILKTQLAYFANNATLGTAADDAEPVAFALQLVDCFLRAGNGLGDLFAVVWIQRSSALCHCSFGKPSAS